MSGGDCKIAPLTAIADRGFVDVLRNLRLSLAVTTEPDRLSLVSAAVGGPEISSVLLAHTRGLWFDSGRLAVATAQEILIFANVERLAPYYPNRRNHFDAFFAPRKAYFTGHCRIHDIILDGNSIIVTNTLFSSISRIDGRFTFTPLWQPPFISDLVPEDRCHLNGIAVMAGEVRYATALATTNSADGWRGVGRHGGALIDTRTGQLLCSDLCMPHSPRVIDDRLIVLETGTGMVLRVDPATGKREVAAELPGMPRGLCAHQGQPSSDCRVPARRLSMAVSAPRHQEAPVLRNSRRRPCERSRPWVPRIHRRRHRGLRCPAIARHHSSGNS